MQWTCVVDNPLFGDCDDGENVVHTNSTVLSAVREALLRMLVILIAVAALRSSIPVR